MDKIAVFSALIFSQGQSLLGLPFCVVRSIFDHVPSGDWEAFAIRDFEVLWETAVILAAYLLAKKALLELPRLFWIQIRGSTRIR
jgi:hypothetical protein